MDSERRAEIWDEVVTHARRWWSGRFGHPLPVEAENALDRTLSGESMIAPGLSYTVVPACLLMWVEGRADGK